jgi:hypothetical protein
MISHHIFNYFLCARDVIHKVIRLTTLLILPETYLLAEWLSESFALFCGAGCNFHQQGVEVIFSCLHSPYCAHGSHFSVFAKTGTTFALRVWPKPQTGLRRFPDAFI